MVYISKEYPPRAISPQDRDGHVFDFNRGNANLFPITRNEILFRLVDEPPLNLVGAKCGPPNKLGYLRQVVSQPLRGFREGGDGAESEERDELFKLLMGKLDWSRERKGLTI